MMLTLLRIDQAALLILGWFKKIDDPFAEDALKKVWSDQVLRGEFLRLQWHLQNAIDADELPALAKPKKKRFENKIFDSVGVPEEMKDFLRGQKDHWIVYSDLVAFLERPDRVPGPYAHSRDALARVAWLLAKQVDAPVSDQAALFAYLAQLIENLEEDDVALGLGETTLKGCVGEILAAAVKVKDQD